MSHGQHVSHGQHTHVSHDQYEICESRPARARTRVAPGTRIPELHKVAVVLVDAFVAKRLPRALDDPCRPFLRMLRPGKSVRQGMPVTDQH